MAREIRKVLIKNEVSRGDGERAASIVEYALLLVFIAILILSSLRFMGSKVSGEFSSTGVILS